MTTNDSSRIVRWLVIIVLGAATGAMVAVSLRANFLSGYGFGQTPEKAYVFGFANVAADMWKAAGLIIITSLPSSAELVSTASSNDKEAAKRYPDSWKAASAKRRRARSVLDVKTWRLYKNCRETPERSPGPGGRAHGGAATASGHPDFPPGARGDPRRARAIRERPRVAQATQRDYDEHLSRASGPSWPPA